MSKYDNYQTLEELRGNLKKMNREIAQNMREELMSDKQQFYFQKEKTYA